MKKKRSRRFHSTGNLATISLEIYVDPDALAGCEKACKVHKVELGELMTFHLLALIQEVSEDPSGSLLKEFNELMQEHKKIHGVSEQIPPPGGRVM